MTTAGPDEPFELAKSVVCGGVRENDCGGGGGAPMA